METQAVGGADGSRNNKFLFICWATYVCTYLCRVNLSSALYKMEDGLGVGTDRLGILGSVFFVVYAIGQLVNGFIGDRVSPYRFVSFAVVGTMLLNIAISLTNNFVVVLLCWGLNGYMQSMIWGPMTRTLSFRFPPEKHVKVSAVMNTSMVTAFILSWTVLGRLFVDMRWQTYFIVPALIVMVFAVIWTAMAVRSKREPGMVAAEHKPVNMSELWGTIKEEKLWLVALTCACLGLIKESVNLWAPIILTQVLGIEIKQSFLFILIIPLANYGGILLARWMASRFAARNVLIALFCGVTAAATALFIIPDASSASIPLIALISGMMYGCNSVLLSMIPMSFSGKNIVSTLVGIFDFFSYVGAAISSFVLGMLLSGAEWKPITAIWMITAAAAVVLCSFYRRSRAKENPA